MNQGARRNNVHTEAGTTAMRKTRFTFCFVLFVVVCLYVCSCLFGLFVCLFVVVCFVSSCLFVVVRFVCSCLIVLFVAVCL